MIAVRRTYLVDKPVQYRYMGIVFWPLVFIPAALYYLMYYSMFSEMLIPEAVVATLLPAMKKVNLIVLIAAPVLGFVVLRAALLYSHRIIGPIPRIERELDRVLAGDYTVRLHARDNDELKDLVKKLNLVIEHFEAAGKK
jgi:methyl-accepting chemotaxis protein